jgi:hypothetical protein
LLIAYCLLLIAYCLLLIAYCLLLIAYCLLLIQYIKLHNVFLVLQADACCVNKYDEAIINGCQYISYYYNCQYNYQKN